jgi:ribonuclease BN (tRNA processing enzyme)
MRTLLIPIVAALSWSVAQTAAPGVARAPATGTKVVCLGTGTPNPDPDRFGPATAVVVNDTPYVVDAGAGVVRRVTTAAKMGIPGMSVPKLTRLFITHLHSDHTIGYPDFIFTPAVTGRTEPLEVYGPPGLEAMTDHILEAWKEDMDIRIHGLERGVARAYEVHVHEVTNGLVYQDANVRVRAFEVEHGSWPHALGYRFETADRTIVISGDTTKSDAILENAKAADVLVHEAYSADALTRRTPEWQKYHSTFHTSGPDLGAIANRVQPKLLVLYHVLAFSATPEEVLAEVQRVYKGKVVLGKDFSVY